LQGDLPPLKPKADQSESSVKGDIGEAAFDLACLKRGIKPFFTCGSGSKDIDRILTAVVDGVRIAVYVQIKTGITRSEDGYFWFGSSKKRSKANLRAADFWACYLEPLDTWYIIPTSSMTSVPIAINPFICHDSRRKSKWEEYRDNWGLIFNRLNKVS
jgi:hypothetical protein